MKFAKKSIITSLSTLMLIVASTIAYSNEKYAFVVGIDVYENFPREHQLQKAVGDSRSIESVFSSLGYNVTQIENPRRSEFFDQWRKFTRQLRQNDVVAVYFSGHGVEVQGANFMLPRDTPLLAASEAAHVKNFGVSLSELQLDLKERNLKISLFIVDACRDDPFRQTGTKGTPRKRGLAAEHPEIGTFIMYSANAGETALDRLSDSDPHPNSIYTRELIPLLSDGVTPLVDIAKKVRARVETSAKSVGHNQFPGYYDGTRRPFCLSGVCGKPPKKRPIPEQPAINAPATSWFTATYEGVDFFEGDIHPNGLLAEDFEVCKIACGANPECRIFTFNRSRKTCWLKRKLKIPLVNRATRSGVFVKSNFGVPDPRPVKISWDLYFNRALNFLSLGGKSRVNSVSECAQICQNQSCRAFSAYSRNGGAINCERKQYLPMGTQKWPGGVAGYPRKEPLEIYPSKIEPISIQNEKIATPLRN